MQTLNDLRPNESGIITEIRLTGLMKRRLIDLGVTTGAQITMLRPAPLGDPVEFYILGYNLSLRRSEARNILIEKVGDTND
jgi:Fe2+ transport system protein FeoA